MELALTVRGRLGQGVCLGEEVRYCRRGLYCRWDGHCRRS